MDIERNGEVLPASDSPQPEEGLMEKVVVSKLETPGESTEPEKSPAADESNDHPAVNGFGSVLKDSEEPPEETAVPESVPSVVAPPEPEDSLEKVLEPVKDSPEEESVPESEVKVVAESTPEPENGTGVAAERTPEPEDETKFAAESTPQPENEPEVVTESEPEKVSEPVGMEAAGQEEKVAKVEAANETGAEVAAAADPKVEEEAKPAEVVVVSTEKPAEVEEAAIEVKTEQVVAELPKEDSGPAPGSVSFALLENEQTKAALRSSRTMVILRGLPGSGKSFLAGTIADAYKEHCTVFCADTYGIKPENIQSCANELAALDAALVARCKETTPVLVVVDDTNHLQNRLAHLGEMAEQHHMVPIFLEPQTDWSRDPEQLSKKTKRGLEAAMMEAMKTSLMEMALPLFFGWFLLSPAQDKINCVALDFRKTLDTMEAFRKHLADFSGKAEEVDLEHYFKPKGALHCTTKFCDYGKAEGAKEYVQNPAVKAFYGSVTELSLSALFVTPRTVGARVSLTEEQLLLWPADAEKSAESTIPGASSLPLGSRAHVTLGCADKVEPVQTGLDLLDILVLQQSGQQGELVEEMELGTLTYQGAGRWMLSLREPIVTTACFSSFYGPKETEVAKPEKKKKPKCAIL